MLDVGYAGAVIIFIVGVITSLITTAYVVGNYYHFKDKDPYEGE